MAPQQPTLSQRGWVNGVPPAGGSAQGGILALLRPLRPQPHLTPAGARLCSPPRLSAARDGDSALLPRAPHTRAPRLRPGSAFPAS